MQFDLNFEEEEEEQEEIFTMKEMTQELKEFYINSGDTETIKENHEEQ